MKTNWMKRMLCLMLSAVLLLGHIPASAFAEEAVPPEETVAEEVTEAPSESTEVTEPETSEPTEPETSEPTEPEVTEPETSAPVEETSEPTEETQPEIPEVETVEEWLVPDVEDWPSDEELFGMYAEGLLYGNMPAVFGTAAGERLTGNTKLAYDALKPYIQRIARGEVSDTSITMGYSHYNITVNGNPGPHIVDVEVPFVGTSIDSNALMHALLADMPYELYWFDKTSGMGSSYFSVNSQLQWTVTFVVAGNYAPGGATGGETTDTAKTGAAATAAANAASVVAAAANLSDYEKLVYYKEYICGAVSYDYTAADSGVFGRNDDPWQLIHVFDGNTSTKVVCEGYSKAFQYLCDLTDFDGDVVCYSVSGIMATIDGYGPHMWNIVSIDGESYLVDVTNSDSGTIGQYGGLFLVGGIADEDVYFFMDDTVAFFYDGETEELWAGTDILTLSPKAEYTPPAEETTPSDTDVEINAANFPDVIFRGYVADEFDTNNNGWLSAKELQNITVVIVSEMGIKSLAGIEYFTEMTYLDCGSNQLTSLDLCENTALEVFDCRNNQLSSLDMSRNTSLSWLNCDENQLTSLDIDNNTAIEYLYCSKNQLTDLDVSRLAGLVDLECAWNQLANLNVSNSTMLKYLSCQFNRLTELDVSRNTMLKDLSCIENQLTSLDVEKNTALTNLYCGRNRLTRLDVSKNTLLESLYCEENWLTSLDVSNNMRYIVVSCPDNTRRITAEKNKFDLSTLPDFDVSRASNWNGGTVSGSILTVTKDTVTYTYDLGHDNVETFTLSVETCDHNWKAATCANPKTCTECGATEGTADPTKHAFKNGVCGECGVVSIGRDAFPDAIFRSYVSEELDADSDGYLTEEEMLSVTTIRISDMEIEDLTGIEHFTVLNILDCSWNQLLTLDVSHNTALEQLWCSKNQLSKLDVSRNTALEILGCGSNQLMELDVSRNTALVELYCEYNLLTELDVTNNTLLEWFSCASNQLTSLDVSKNTELEWINCSTNNRTVTAKNGQFDLSTLPGFDITKASNWSGGTVNGTILTATSDTVTYSYAIGNNRKMTFTLTIDGVCAHKWTEADCTTPRTCSVCGATDGEALGHRVYIDEVVEYDPLRVENADAIPFTLTDGIYYSANHDNNSSSELRIVAEESCSLTLNYGVSSEGGWDKFYILHNDEQKATISGDFTDQVLTLELAAGDVVTVRYTKDFSASSGQDQGWVTLIYDHYSYVVGDVPADSLDTDCTHDVVCTYCDAVVKKAPGHSEVTDARVEPTCTETGLTEGKHCSVCNEVLKAQTVISMKGHSFGDWTVTVAPSAAEAGEERRDCANCDHFETREIEKIAGIAVIGTNAYTTVEEALAAAKSGDTITLVADAESADLMIKPGVTLNLGQYDLTADFIVAFKGGVIQATPNAGRLIVPKGNLILSEAGTNEKGQSILPVWDPANENYVFSLFVANTGNDARGLFINEEEGTLFFQWKHQATGAINKGLMADNGSTDNDVTMLVRLQWGDEDGVAYQNYVFKDSFVQKAAGSFDYTVTLKGIDTLGIDLSTLVVTAMITTESGAEAAGQIWTIENAK